MACVNKMDNSARVIIGVARSFSVRANGLWKITFVLSEALEKLPKTSASLMLPLFFGLKNTAFHAAPLQKRERSNIGVVMARTTRCGASEGNSTHDGLAESPRSDKPSIPVKSGSRLAALFGSEITRRVAGVDSTKMMRGICLFISTTLFRSQTKIFVQSLPIWFCCARPVTCMSIHGGI